MKSILLIGLVTLCMSMSLTAEDPKTQPTSQPIQSPGFEHARITEAWAKFADVLTFGEGQTLALLDDGCKPEMPQWKVTINGKPKTRVRYDAVDQDDNAKHEGRGYHGSTIGNPSSLNFEGKHGVAFNNQIAIVRSLECCHCRVADAPPLARALQWVIDHHKEHQITTVNLSPVDDKEHAEPLATEIDAKLTQLRKLGIWVSAPAGNHHFTEGISWPASQPDCFAIGAVKPGKDEIHLDRHKKVDLVVPASATSSSNAILCGASMLLREAIQKSEYDWRSDGANLPEAMIAIFQKTGRSVEDPLSGNTFKRLDLVSALDHVLK